MKTCYIRVASGPGPNWTCHKGKRADYVCELFHCIDCSDIATKADEK